MTMIMTRENNLHLTVKKLEIDDGRSSPPLNQGQRKACWDLRTVEMETCILPLLSAGYWKQLKACIAWLKTRQGRKRELINKRPSWRA